MPISLDSVSDVLDAILIDDDELVHLTWKMAAETAANFARVHHQFAFASGHVPEIHSHLRRRQLGPRHHG